LEREEMVKLKVFFIVLFFLSLVMVLSSLFLPAECIAEERVKEEVPVVGGTYRKPLESSPKTFDPALATDIFSVTVIQQIFDGLIQFDKDLNVIPAIAKSWKISPDGLTYTFFLREGVKFHNGREVTAKDFFYSFNRILDPKTKSPAAGLLDRVLGFKEFREGNASEVRGFLSPGRYILEIKLSEPYSPFLSIMGMNKFKVLPKEEVEKSGIPFAKSPVGTGPFKCVSVKEGEEIILEANLDYFEGRPYLDKIILRIFHGAPRERILREFREGSLEESLVPPEAVEEFVRERSYLFIQKPILALRFYGFNGLSKPLDNKNLRKAINFGIDKAFIISEIHRNQFNLARGILPPGMPGYDPQRDLYPNDETRAREYLIKAGYSPGRSVPPLDIWSGSKSEAAQKELSEIKSQLKQIGLTANINFETNWPNFESMLRSHKAPIFIYAWYADFPDPDNFLGTLFHSQSAYNFMAYHNSEVDRLLVKAKTERDYLKRMELYRKIEEIILEDAPILPMVNPIFQVVYQPYVKGVEVNALGGPYIPMKKIWFKKRD
jgi:peptide/nickel transport system substrate-binding protein/oligopeptide transport system substrate-binding protein